MTIKISNGVKTRRHHNNAGLKQIKSGKTYDQIKAKAKRMGINFGKTKKEKKDF